MLVENLSNVKLARKFTRKLAYEITIVSSKVEKYCSVFFQMIFICKQIYFHNIYVVVAVLLMFLGVCGNAELLYGNIRFVEYLDLSGICILM